MITMQFKTLFLRARTQGAKAIPMTQVTGKSFFFRVRALRRCARKVRELSLLNLIFENDNAPCLVAFA